MVGAIEADGGQALAVRADSADAAAVKSAVAQTVQAFGRLDVLVNNAGKVLVAALDQLALAGPEAPSSPARA